jgi:hypothetical protein
MLVDGKFDDKGSALIKNEDVIILYLNVLQKVGAHYLDLPFPIFWFGIYPYCGLI